MLKSVILVCAFVCMHVLLAILGTPKGENQDFPIAQIVRILPAMQETWVRSLGQEDPPGEGNGNPLQYFCLENLMNGRRSLVGYSPWGHKKSNTT